MKSERRHDLQTNVLADWMGEKVKKVQANATWIGGGFLLILIIVVFLFVRQSRLSSVANEGWTRFQQARSSGLVALAQQQPLALNNVVRDLENIAREYAGNPIAAYTNLTLGDLQLQNGRMQYSLNKTAARDAFQSAANYYKAAADGTESPDTKNQARFCQGKSLEWQSKLSQAKEIYGKVTGPYRLEAEERIRSLDRNGTESFYKQYAEWKPKPADTSKNRYDKVDFKLEDQSAPLSAEIEAALQNVGVEDAAEEAAAEGGQAPAEKTDAGSETKKPEPAPADDAGEASPATTPDK